TQSDDVFKALGAHGVVRRGNGIQVIVGLHVPQVRDQLENLMKGAGSSLFAIPGPGLSFTLTSKWR
ncbi:hypothetical protein ACG0XL_26130, partial [Klebsiella pneumoniae]|uniref:hypothetical protein n=1 Tax=Klebsiella pneumoniae TaxID=573 RepID=UPI0037465E03